MSTTTKIFIVLQCLLVLIFTPMTIQFVARTHNWKEVAEEFRKTALSSQILARNVTALNFAEKEQRADEFRKKDDQLRALNDKITSLSQEKRDLAADKARLTQENVSLDARNTMLAAAVKVKSDENLVLTESNKDLRTRNDTLTTKNVELGDRVRELSAAQLVLNQKIRMLEEENLVARQENERLRSLTGAPPSTAVGPVGPVPTAAAEGLAAPAPIRGKITSVEGTNALIDVGQSSGVRKGMVFVVHRGGKYLADLRIEDAQPNESVGRLELLGQGQVQAEDSVTDKASLEGMR